VSTITETVLLSLQAAADEPDRRGITNGRRCQCFVRATSRSMMRERPTDSTTAAFRGVQ
jgi:hypothetical protein